MSTVLCLSKCAWLRRAFSSSPSPWALLLVIAVRTFVGFRRVRKCLATPDMTRVETEQKSTIPAIAPNHQKVFRRSVTSPCSGRFDAWYSLKSNNDSHSCTVLSSSSLNGVIRRSSTLVLDLWICLCACLHDLLLACLFHHLVDRTRLCLPFALVPSCALLACSFATASAFALALSFRIVELNRSLLQFF